MVSVNAVSAQQQQEFTSADVNGDGYLTEAEFSNQFPNENFTDYDKDGDGKVTKEEYDQKSIGINKSIADNLWKMAMKMFHLDEIKKPDLGIETPDYIH